MDAELQKSIRELNPADVATHGVWYRLTRVYPLHEVVGSIPLTEMTVSQLLQHSGKVVAEISKKIRGIKPLKLKYGVYRWAHPKVNIPRNTTATALFQRLSELFLQCGQEINEEFTPQISAHIDADCNYYDGDVGFNSLEIRFDIHNTREETPEEEAGRLQKEKLAKEKIKKEKQEKYKKAKVEKEQLELAECQLPRTKVQCH